MQRLAIANKIQGNRVDTQQNVMEHNNGAILESLKRLAIANDIKGNTVVTHQQAKEFNNEEMRPQNDETANKQDKPDDGTSNESEDELIEKSEANGELSDAANDAPGQALEDFIEQPNPGIRSLHEQVNAQLYNDMLKRNAIQMQNAALQNQVHNAVIQNQLQNAAIQSQLQNAAAQNTAMQNAAAQNAAMQNAASQNAAMQNAAAQNAAVQNGGMQQLGYAHTARLFDESNEMDDLMRRSEADDALSTTDRRMTVNNNLSEKRMSRMANSNPSAAVQIMVTQPRKPTALECKTGDGKTVYEADVNEFRKLLANIKAVQ
jgi:hypothetical protein